MWITSTVLSIIANIIIAVIISSIRAFQNGGFFTFIQNFVSKNTIAFSIFSVIMFIPIFQDLISITANFLGIKYWKEVEFIPGLDGGNTADAVAISRKQKWFLVYPLIGAFVIYGLWVNSLQ